MNRKLVTSLAAVVLLAATSAAQAPEKVSDQMPKPAPTRPFAFPKAVTRTLANGLKVFVVSNNELPAVAVQLVLTSAGSVNDPAGKPGIANLTADMLTQGTTKRSAQQIASAIDFVGGSLSARAGIDGSNVSLSVVKKDLDTGLDLMADVLRNAAFQEGELNRRRQQLLSSLQVQYADAGYLANAVLDRALFGNHPYGLPGEGTPKSVRAITRADLAQFRDTYYVPNQALLAFSGDITPEAAFAAAEKYFGAWGRKEIPGTGVSAPSFNNGVRVTLIDKPDAVQTEIRAGRSGLARNHPDYIPLTVTNRVFGGGFNSRLSVEVRQKKGLTYGAYSGLESNKLGGSFSASTSTRTEATVEATKLVVDLIGKMSTGEATKEELDFARDYLVGVFPLQSETPAQVAGRVLHVAQYGLPADYYDTYREKVAAVGPAEIKRAAGQYFSTGNLEIVLTGNAGAFREVIKKEFPGAKFDEISFDQVDLLSADLRKPKEAAGAATPESIARAKEIIGAAIEASGGASAIERIKSIAFTAAGKFETPQGAMDVTVKTQAAFPDKLWMELGTPAFTMQQGFDGKSGWLATPQGTMDLPPTQAPEAQRGMDLIGGWGVYREAIGGKINASFVGEKDFQGKKAQAVEWTCAAGKVTLFFDPQNKLLIGAAFHARTVQGTFDAVNTWSDFRPVEGVQFPHHWVTLRDGVKFSDSTVTEVKLNVALEPKQFSKPN